MFLKPLTQIQISWWEEALPPGDGLHTGQWFYFLHRHCQSTAERLEASPGGGTFSHQQEAYLLFLYPAPSHHMPQGIFLMPGRPGH